MEKEREAKSDRRNFWIFIGQAFLISWLFWIPAALTGRDMYEGNILILFVLGGFGPSLSGIIMIYRSKDRQGRREFWKRVIDFKRISSNWYLVIFLVFPVVFGLAVGTAYLLGMPLPGFEQFSQIASNPLILIGIMLSGLLTGPLAEELGWRGYALDRLQNQRSPLVASLLLAPLWWAWHLPLFFIQGTTQNKWEIGSLEFWSFLAAIVPLTILLTWAYNRNQKSILAAVLMHFMYNFTMGMVYPLSENIIVLHVVFLYLAAAGIIVVRLTDRSPAPQSSMQ